MNKVVIYQVDDWQCMYVNGVDQYQNHSIPLFELSPHCPIESLEVRWAEERLDSYVSEKGNFPQYIDECIDIEKDGEIPSWKLLPNK